MHGLNLILSPFGSTIAESKSKTLTGALEFCFRQFADSTAIDAPGSKMTYAELDSMSRHLALEIRTRYSDQQLKAKPIAISMSRSVEFYVAQIAVLRAGGFFFRLILPSRPNALSFFSRTRCHR